MSEEALMMIDGCIFTCGDFIGLAEYARASSLTAFFLTVPGSHAGFSECCDKIGGIYNLADNPEEMLLVARTVDDLYRARAEGKKAIILTFQDPHPVENSLDKLRTLYELGLRVMQMTYNNTNYLGTGCTEPLDTGLTEFGKAALKMMNRLGIVADASHCGHKTTADILRLSEKPVVISHAGALALTDSPRNKSDEELKLLKANGGVIGLSSWGPLCWKKADKRQPSLRDFVDHINYVVDLIGVDHIGFGSDNTLDGNADEAGTVTQSTLYPAVVADYDKHVGTKPSVRHAQDIDGCWQIENVYAELRKDGYSEQDIEKFAGGNFLRVIKQNWR